MSSQVHLNTKPTDSLPASNFRVSTRNLIIANTLVKTAAFYAAYSANPTHALSGALFGASLRFLATLLGGDDQEVIKLGSASERLCRARQTSSICLTAATAAYAQFVPGTHVVTPFFLGSQATSDGLYPLLRRTLG